MSLRAFLVVALGTTFVPTQAVAAQPSPFSPAPNAGAQSGAPAPPPGPAVPPRTQATPAATDTTSGASPLVADALTPATGSATGPPPAATDEEKAEAETSPAIEAVADNKRFALGAGGHVAFGSAPAVAVGVRVSAEVATGRWSLGLEGRYDFPSSAHTTQGGEARTTLASGAFVPCLRAKGTWACGVVMVGRTTGDASDASGKSVHDASTVVGFGARLVMHFSLPLDFALRVGGEVLGHPVPYEVDVSGQRVFRASVVSMLIGPTVVRVF